MNMSYFPVMLLIQILTVVCKSIHMLGKGIFKLDIVILFFSILEYDATHV
jgi:hypothetical protein